MKINFDQKVMDPTTGRPIIFDNRGSKPVPAFEPSLKEVCMDALAPQYRDEVDLPAMDKFKRGLLLKKLFESTADGCEVSAEEVSEIKKVVGKYYGPAVIVSTWELLEKPIQESQSVN